MRPIATPTVLVSLLLAGGIRIYACESCGYPEDSKNPKAHTSGSELSTPKWGGDGHRWINEYAVDNLPDAMFNDGSGNAFNSWREFLRTHASDADYLKGSDYLESPRHYCDIDMMPTLYPEPFATVPRDYDDYVSAFGRGNGVVMWEGIAEHAAALRIALKTRNWAAAKQAAADVGHYVGDAHSPFHAVANYNGQLTGQTGIHARHESTLLSRYFDSSFLRTRRSDNPIGGSSAYISDPVEFGFDIIVEGYFLTIDILAADLEARNLDSSYGTTYYAEMWSRVGQVTVADRVNKGAERLADVWFTAWTDAGSQDFELAPRAFPAEAATPEIDGDLNDMGGWANLQTTTTDQNDGADDFEDNLNELNRMLVNADSDTFYLGLAGNLSSDHAVIVWLDTMEGGSSTLVSAGPPVVGGLSGTTLDPAFRPDYALYIARTNSGVSVSLVDLGARTTTTLGNGAISGFDFENGLGGFALDNSNIAGVKDRAGRTVEGCESVDTGIELALSRSLVGLEANKAEVKLLAVIVRNSTPVFVSNQFIPGMPIGAENPGTETPRDWRDRAYALYRLPARVSEGLQFY